MYRTIETGFWTDPKVKAMPTLGKAFFLYAITNNHTHSSGIYVLARVTAAYEFGVTVPEVDTLCHTLSGSGLARFDAERDLIWIVNMLAYQAWGEKNFKMAAKHLTTLHNSPLIQDFLQKYPQVRPFYSDRVSDTHSGAGLQEQEQEQEQNQEKSAQTPETSGPFEVGGFSSSPARRHVSDHRRHQAEQKLADGDPAIKAALAAFDGWAVLAPPIGRGYPLDVHANEAAHVFTLVAALRDRTKCSTILFNGTQTSPELLIPQAIDTLRKQRNPARFTNPTYACGCVRNELERWATGSMPVTRPAAATPSRAETQLARVAALMESATSQLAGEVAR